MLAMNFFADSLFLKFCRELGSFPLSLRFEIPASFCTESTEDRAGAAGMEVMDLSRLREGEEARLAEREWMDVAKREC